MSKSSTPSKPLANQRHELFAQAVARGKSLLQAAIEAGYSDKSGKTGQRLSQNVLVSDRIAALKGMVAAEVVQIEITVKNNRLRDYDNIRGRIFRLIAARAEEHAAISGGDTGLIVRQVKQIGHGKDAQVVEEYAADTALLRELREYNKQAAIEMGQYSEKRELTGKDGGPIEHRVATVSDEDLEKLEPAEMAIVRKLVESAAGKAVAEK